MKRDRTTKPCVFPSPAEQELATIPGTEPGTALRVWVEPGPGGFVRLEQLAFDEGLGWYTQKSFCVSGELLPALLPQLRKADCLIPRDRTATQRPSHLRLVPAPTHADEPIPERRDA